MHLRRLTVCALLLAASPAPRAGADLFSTSTPLPASTEPWAFTAPRPRSVLRMEQADTLAAGMSVEAREHFAAAHAALAEDALGPATVEIQQALAMAPDNPLIIGLAGRIFCRQRSFGLALNCWRHLLALFPRNAAVRAELGFTLLLIDDEDKDGRQAIEEALLLSPGDTSARYLRAVLYVMDREYKQASAMFDPLTGTQIMATIRRLQEDRDLIQSLTSPEGYRAMGRAVLHRAAGSDIERTLADVYRLLKDTQPHMQANQWAKALPHLMAIRKTGAAFPALEYDLNLCRYNLRPSIPNLDAMEAFIRSPRGEGFVRYFCYLCIAIGDYERAQRLADIYMKDSVDGEAILLRAAICQGMSDPDGAWTLLDSIPAATRHQIRPWFNRAGLPIQQLLQNERFAAWMNGSKATSLQPAP